MADQDSLLQLIEKAAANMVMLEVDDAAALTALAASLRELSSGMAGMKLAGALEANAAAALLDQLAAGQTPDSMAALETIMRTVIALQSLLKGKESPANIHFPPGLITASQEVKPPIEQPPAPPPEPVAAPQPVKKETPSMNKEPSHHEAKPPRKSLAGKYLTFKISAEDYGLEILKVQEIIKMMDITKVPRTPEFVRGVINLRGKVIPVVDLRLKFAMDAIEATEKTCIIVVQVARRDSKVTMGIIVDEVSEVLDISDQEIEPAPSFGTNVDTQFILGMAKAKGTVKILLDIDRVLSAGEVAALGGVSN
ncbi:MAG: chemotaxis protein CheW [Lentisphaerota bacterium]